MAAAGAGAGSGVRAAVRAFLAAAKSGGVGVVGASSDRAKFGNKVLRAYQKHGFNAVPVNPKGGEIEGVASVTSVSELPAAVVCLSIITPPKFADGVVKDAAAHGVKHLWFQPGAWSETAVKTAVGDGMSVIADGTCVLVQLGVADHE